MADSIHSADAPPSTGEGVLLLSAADLADVLGVSLRTVRRLDSYGKLPRPVRLGRAVRWRRDEVARWVEAGCPDRSEWEEIE